MSTATAPVPPVLSPQPGEPARILVFDSGLGGLTVFAEIAKLRPTADFLYVADDAVFPYGRLSEAALIERVAGLMGRLIGSYAPDVVVIACNTASTAVLPPLRELWPGVPFVGTVPAIKPAAALSRSKMISVLATPGTVEREYTRDLVRVFARDCSVTLVGAAKLAMLAEGLMRGETVADPAVLEEIAPAFVVADGGRTDTIVLACTHYPLLMPMLDRLAPWPVTFLDPAPAIARRVEALLSGQGLGEARALEARYYTSEACVLEPRRSVLFTSAREPPPALQRALLARGLPHLGKL